MNSRLLGLAAALVWAGTLVTSAHADQRHPTIHAAKRYAHRKAAHVDHAVQNAHSSYKHWKQRKGHQVRAWLNRH